jgi:hypothetical protein
MRLANTLLEIIETEAIIQRPPRVGAADVRRPLTGIRIRGRDTHKRDPPGIPLLERPSGRWATAADGFALETIAASAPS